MRHLYFGSPDRRLYGVHQEPAAGKGRSTRVVLCYPGVQEYNTLHWSFRNLASMLARDGFDVLRFDYFGTGDSAGDPTDGDLQGWADDIRTAAEELLDATNAKPLKLVGMRLGAVLASRACESGLDVDELVLWDPVLRGGVYLDELELLDRQRNLVLLHGASPRANELLGYRISDVQRRDLRGLVLDPPKVPKLSLFASTQRAEHAAFVRSAEALGAKTRYEIVPDEAASVTTGDGAALHTKLIAAITHHLAEAT